MIIHDDALELGSRPDLRIASQCRLQQWRGRRPLLFFKITLSELFGLRRPGRLNRHGNTQNIQDRRCGRRLGNSEKLHRLACTYGTNAGIPFTLDGYKEWRLRFGWHPVDVPYRKNRKSLTHPWPNPISLPKQLNALGKSCRIQAIGKTTPDFLPTSAAMPRI